MKWFDRKNGISVLIACQNEEALIALCILSFLEFGDELIVVDNGSTDRSKEIIRDLQSMHPRKIKFYDVPELPDLYHNREYAFSKSSYRWVARIDADFVAYTDGENNIVTFREELLAQKRSLVPKMYGFWLPNLFMDFWHTGTEREPGKLNPNDPGRYVPPPMSHPTLRIYEVFPGFRFQRLGRWEGVRFQRILNRTMIELDYPLWMHCNLKKDRDYLFRSERTNWRQLGDFERYPTLESYLKEVIKQRYGTDNIDEAAQLYLQKNVLPFIRRYDPDKYCRYPRLIREQIERNCIYKITKRDGITKREYFGIDPLPYKRTLIC